MGTQLTGGCLCGALRFRIEGKLGPIGHCHCGTCQKAQGVAFATTARVSKDAFRWTTNETFLREYESTPGKQRSFCARCGSKLFAAWSDQDQLILRLGSLDEDPYTRPVIHIWTEERADWFTISDQLPQWPTNVPPNQSDTERLS